MVVMKIMVKSGGDDDDDGDDDDNDEDREDDNESGVEYVDDNNESGPYQVVSRLSDVTYRIQRSPRSKLRVVHFDRLKLYSGSDIPDAWRTQPADRTDEVTTDREPDVVNNGQPTQASTEITVEPGIPLPDDSSDSDVNPSRYPRRQRRPPDYFY
ncbi:uncharacterized protein LOC135155273 [Lytechinus pictus]|uniref:uncharacterized protein LOC135155273 n=1 Tax=Lytechinus pictus TaxID=7653 RepID=UPI0030B9C038